MKWNADGGDQGMTIRENATAGILIVDQGLVIRRVTRHQSGRYSCTAVNNEGTGVSNTVQLRVMRTCLFFFFFLLFFFHSISISYHKKTQ